MRPSLGTSHPRIPGARRIVDPCHEAAERDADVEMRTSIGDEEDECRGDRHVRRDPKQDRHDRKKGVGQHPFQPEMSGAGDERNAVRAVVERVHRPQQGDRVLKPMERVSVEVERHHHDRERDVPL